MGLIDTLSTYFILLCIVLTVIVLSNVKLSVTFFIVMPSVIMQHIMVPAGKHACLVKTLYK
jgi:hypothetical protein